MRQYLVGLLALAVLAAPAAVVANGRGHGHGHGGHGDHGGSPSTPAVSASPSVSASPADASALSLVGVNADPSKAYAQTIDDTRACTAPPTPGNGLVFVRVSQDGSFRYGGYEFATPDFVDCLKDRGYAMPEAGRAALTNFGAR